VQGGFVDVKICGVLRRRRMNHYPLITFPEEEELTYSSIHNGEVTVYLEKPNNAKDDFMSVVIKIPNVRIVENNGYPQELLDKRLSQIRRLTKVIMELAADKGDRPDA
jgi:hypothetical protein